MRAMLRIGGNGSTALHGLVLRKTFTLVALTVAPILALDSASQPEAQKLGTNCEQTRPKTGNGSDNLPGEVIPLTPIWHLLTRQR